METPDIIYLSPYKQGEGQDYIGLAWTHPSKFCNHVAYVRRDLIEGMIRDKKERIEQKPVEYLDKDKVYAIMKKLHELAFSQLIPIDSEEYKQIGEITKDVRDLLDYPIEQKPVDFPTTDEEVNEFLETHSKVEVPEKYKTPDFVFSKQEYESYPIISKDTTSVKPAEWSEEDEETLKDIIAGLEATKQLTYRHEPSGRACYNKWIAWLKLLRNRVGKESLQPHWKPSEEQMRALLKVVDKARELHYTSIDGYDGYNELRSLYEQIKKLM